MIVMALTVAAVLAMAGALAPKPPARAISGDDGSPDVRRGLIRRIPNRRRPGRVDPIALAAWCDALARALRGGATLRHALCRVPSPASVAAQLAPVLLALERGASVSTALADFDAGSHDLDLVIVVVRACAEHGGSAAEPIDRAAAALRQRAALAGERRTNSAQARMSALVMTGLPAAMLMLLTITSGSVRAAATSPVGSIAIAIGALLNIAGWHWMRQLIGRATR
jgi:Flp pilus assembly protein TadB